MPSGPIIIPLPGWGHKCQVCGDIHLISAEVTVRDHCTVCHACNPFRAEFYEARLTRRSLRRRAAAWAAVVACSAATVYFVWLVYLKYWS